MTTTVEAGRNLTTIVSVDVHEFRTSDGTLYDRDIHVTLLCGCSHHYGLPLHATTPRVGETARCWGFCK